MWFGEHDQPYAPGDLRLAVVVPPEPQNSALIGAGPWFGKRSNWVRR
jgi:hypothetical protein